MYCDHLKRHEIIIFAFWLSTAGEKRGSCRVGGESTAAALAKRGGAGRAGWARKSSSGQLKDKLKALGRTGKVLLMKDTQEPHVKIW